MTLLRVVLFNAGFFLWTLLFGLIGLPLLLAPRRTVMRFGTVWSAATLRLLAWTVGLTHEVRGAENLPKGAAIIAMKHQSAWDTLALPVIFDDPAAVIKRELGWLPIYGWYVRRAGAIPVDRSGGASALKRMIAKARAAAAEGRLIAIFPEGTRTAVGARAPYHPGVAALYTQLGLPLVPVAVNSGLFWGRRSFIKKPGRIVVEILPPIAPGLARRAVMTELEARIEETTARLVADARPR
ncbi:MAG: 1-acyl-sn-glycerol-3-phosphate acyltransferase [Alphaproteobacteria bacterium]|nr:1-acyl-sn-glycerol-3-phosphate acyltransferase [Alphaproteobacteria bacterium]